MYGPKVFSRTVLGPATNQSTCFSVLQSAIVHLDAQYFFDAKPA